MIYENNISEQISSHQNPAEVIDHLCDDNGINELNTEEEEDVTYINLINSTNYIYMNDDDNFIHKYYVLFSCQITTNMYLVDYNMIQRN